MQRLRVPGLEDVTHHVRAATRFAPGRPAVWLGLRTAAATALALALGPRLNPASAVWAALGGFGVSLVDRGGAYRTRATRMALTTAGALPAIVLGSVVAGHGAATVAVVTVALTACALAQIGGAPGASIGNTIGLQVIVASS
ncbi:MAG TPA: hypothetical protein VHE35_09305, partial [Kofleriaceae bacterium]|nr:hypothetical protein [Kofleriaceae bacterium]